MRKFAIYFAVFFILAPVSAAHARCLQYEPATVTLVGSVTTRTVPGPPGYVSYSRGDMPETIVILQLAEAVCISRSASRKSSEKSHSDVKEIQLSISESKARAYVGKRVRAVGTLFGAQSGHHRTPVVLRVTDINGA